MTQTHSKWQGFCKTLSYDRVGLWYAIGDEFAKLPKSPIINPVTWNEHCEQTTQEPVLLIHGKYASENDFARLVRRLLAQGIGPLFTVNFNHPGNRPIEHAKKDYQTIADTVIAIEKLFHSAHKPSPKITLLGHSYGAILGSYYALGDAALFESDNPFKIMDDGYCQVNKDKIAWRENISRIIRLCHPVTNAERAHFERAKCCDRIIDIYPERDSFVSNKSELPQSQQVTLPKSYNHLSVLNNPNAVDVTLSIIKNQTVEDIQAAHCCIM